MFAEGTPCTIECLPQSPGQRALCPSLCSLRSGLSSGMPRCPPPRPITLREPGREGWGTIQVLIFQLQILLSFYLGRRSFMCLMGSMEQICPSLNNFRPKALYLQLLPALDASLQQPGNPRLCVPFGLSSIPLHSRSLSHQLSVCRSLLSLVRPPWTFPFPSACFSVSMHHVIKQWF